MQVLKVAAASLVSLALVGSSLEAAAPAPVAAQHGMVVSAHRLASKAGLDVLKSGGNAIDAAVAVAYALAVTFPEAGNIGGGGFMTIRLANGQTRFIDFRETAPAAATATMFQDAAGNVVPLRSTRGYLAAGIPGTVAGLEIIRKRHAFSIHLPLPDGFEFFAPLNDELVLVGQRWIFRNGVGWV